MRIVVTLILFFCSFLLIGQTATITGRFLYSGQESFAYGIYDNPLMQASFPIIGEEESDSNGYFSIKISIDKPEILHLKWAQDTYRCYIRPGDSLDMQILNRFNVQFAGTGAPENTTLFAGEFQQSFYAGDPLEEGLLALDTLAAKRRAVLAVYEQEAKMVDLDFVQYFNAEMIGHRFDRLNRVYHSHIKQQPENPILAIASNELMSLEALNEVRSRAYLNAVINYIEKQLERALALGEVPSEDLSAQWQMRREWANEWTADHPQLRQGVSFIQLLMQLWRVEGEQALEGVNQEWTALKGDWPDSKLHPLVATLYEEKQGELKLLSLKDLNFQNSLGQGGRLSEHGIYPKVVLLFSSSSPDYQDQLSFFTSIFSPALKKGQLLVINLEPESVKVEKSAPTLKDNVDYVFLTKEAAATFLLDYPSDQFPVYLYFKAPLEPTKASYQLDQTFMREVYGIRTRQ